MLCRFREGNFCVKQGAEQVICFKQDAEAGDFALSMLHYTNRPVLIRIICCSSSSITRFDRIPLMFRSVITEAKPGETRPKYGPGTGQYRYYKPSGDQLYACKEEAQDNLY